MHCLYPHPQSDVVQLNAPEYNLDIDGQPDLVPDIQSSIALHTASTAQQSPNAEKFKKDTAPDTANSEQHTITCPDTDRPESQPPPVQMILTIQDTKTLNNQGQSTQVTTDPNWKISQN